MFTSKKASNGSCRTRILQIAYSPVVLVTRQMLLEGQGYSVVSVLGNEEAFALVARSKEIFDLVLLGHSVDVSVRRDAARFFKRNFPGVRVVALRSEFFIGEVQEADNNTDVEDPGEWLGTVRKLAA